MGLDSQKFVPIILKHQTQLELTSHELNSGQLTMTRYQPFQQPFLPERVLQRCIESARSQTEMVWGQESTSIVEGKVRRGYSDGGVIPIVGCLCYQTKFGNSSVVPQGRLSINLPCGTTEELPNFVW